MSDRYQGGVIRATPLAPTSSSASGIWTMEQQAKAQAAGDWPVPPLLVDPNFNQVSMLLSGEPAGGLDYTAFSDASTNNFLITPSGNPYGTAFSPYNSTYSNYFDGSGDYVTSSSTGIIPTSGSWTVDGWIFLTGSASNAKFLSQGTSGSSGRVSMGVEGGSWWIQVGENQINTGTPTRNQWLYVGITFNGTTLSFYVNGSLIGSTTPSQSVQNAALNIGTDWLNYYWPGYISNLRISDTVRTVTSVPTALFTVDANTLFLGCASNRFIDQSANAYALTVSGNTAISGFIPFTDTDTTTGSGNFPGSSYVFTPSSSAFTVGSSGDFTIELWVYPVSPANYQCLLSTWNGGTSNRILLRIWADGTLQWYNSLGNSAILSSSGAAPKGRWTHVAIVRSGSTITLYANGQSLGTQTTNQDYTTDDYLTIADGNGFTGSDFNGYVSNFRFIKGTAVYTTTFTPPTAPLTAVSGTSLLTLQDRAANQNTGFIDTSKRQSFTSTSGSPTQGTFSPFSQADGYWSNYFNDATSDYMTVPDTGNKFDFGSGDFSIEVFAYYTATGEQHIVSKRNVSGSSGFYFAAGGSRQLEFTYWSSGTEYNVMGGTVTANGWKHLVACRSGSTISVYIDGTRAATASISGSIDANSTNLYVGAAADPLGRYTTGYFSNLRISTTTSVYDATQTTITVPTAPLTATASTQLLTCQSNRFIDNSANGFAITASGAPSVQSFGPFAPTDAYSPAVNGGSLYLDGSSYITTANMGGFGSGDFTVEAWVYSPWIYPSSGLPVPVFIAGTGGEFAFGFFGDALYYGTSEVANILYYSVGNQRNNWMHVAVTRSSGTTNLYYNGVRVGTTSNSEDWAADNYWIGRRGDGSTGLAYITDLRVLKGTALYTGATYTIPTAPLTVVNGTELLYNFTNAGVWDSAARNDLGTLGASSVQTSVTKFGSGALYIAGTNTQYMPSVSKPVMTLSGDFTIECWAYSNDTGGLMYIFGIGDAATSSGLVGLYFRGDGVYAYGNGTQLISSGTTQTVSTWYHLAFVRSGSTVTMYRNGTSVGSTTYTQTPSGTVYVGVGNAGGTLYSQASGYVDDLRITNGVARYTTNFTPANYPFPVK